MRLAGFDGSAVGPHPGYWRYGARTVHPDAGQACLPTDQWRSDCFGTTQPIVGDVLVGDVLGRRVTRSVAIGRSIKLRVTRPAKSRRRGPISGRDTGTTTRRGGCFVAARETGLHTSESLSDLGAATADDAPVLSTRRRGKSDPFEFRADGPASGDRRRIYS